MPLTRRAMTLGMLGSCLALAGRAGAGLRIDGGHAFGSSWRITTGGETDLPAIRPVIARVIAEVDGQMSPFRAASDLSAFNAARTTAWQPMPPALCQVTSAALGTARLTGGAFDPTVGPIVSRLGFGPIEGGRGDHSSISVRGNALRKTAPDLTLDLCGIAKGHALDRIVAALAAFGVTDALVELGGEVKALGTHPTGRPWQVAIAEPDATGFAVRRIIAPGHLALATSGHAANGVHGPVATSHIIDPHRGQAASNALLSVSVLAASAMQADALATALCAAGPEPGVAMARRRDIAALFVIEGADGASDIMTGRFPHHVLI